MPARISGLLLIFLCLTQTLRAQSTEADIKALLNAKPLYLRGFWSNDKLNFDAASQLQGTSARSSFTLSGFDFKNAELKNDKLILEGRRVGVEFDRDKAHRVPLNQKIHIEIAASPTGDYRPALDTIFVNGLAKVTPTLPDYWQTFVAQHYQGVAETRDPSTKTRESVKPPTLIHMDQPVFTIAARDLQYSGISVVSCQIGTDGVPDHIFVLHPIGLGLDEAAVKAVRNYRFSPATENGNPIAITLHINVNFVRI